MITLITGAPGAGKTAALVDLLSGLPERAIYVDGIPELTVTHEVLSDASQWPTVVPDGAAVVIDEVQRVWRPSGTGSKVPPDIQALETHRHRGLDFFIVTQHPNLVHQNVRRLVGRHVHLRDVGVLGRWWYEWPEASDPARFRTAPVKKRYRLPKGAFSKYRSASLHVKPIRALPLSVVVAGGAFIGFGVLAWMGYSSVKAKVNASAALAPAAVASAPAGHHVADLARQGTAQAARWPVYDSGPVRRREPYHGRALVMEGAYSAGRELVAWFGLYVEGRRVTTVSLAELVRAGYSFTQLGPCAGVLSFGDLERSVTCGAAAPAAPDGAPGGGAGSPAAAAAAVSPPPV